MPFMRNGMRTTDTEDLSARLQCTGRRTAARRVLNLSEGGMLVTGADLGIGELADFELAGEDFHSVGVAEVTHQTGSSTGLRFLRWTDPAGFEMADLISARVHREQYASAERTHPGAYLG